jgi:hypothetical protein
MISKDYDIQFLTRVIGTRAQLTSIAEETLTSPTIELDYVAQAWDPVIETHDRYSHDSFISFWFNLTKFAHSADLTSWK